MRSLVYVEVGVEEVEPGQWGPLSISRAERSGTAAVYMSQLC
jgi:hypothetical protein